MDLFKLCVYPAGIVSTHPMLIRIVWEAQLQLHTVLSTIISSDSAARPDRLPSSDLRILLAERTFIFTTVLSR
jgi:hypothetical protein